MTQPIDTSPEAIAALLADVTPGPWAAESGHTQQNGQLYWQVNNEYDAIMQNQFCWAQGDHAANARFIAASRDLVPAMAAEIARLTAERDEARALVAILLAILHGEEGMGNVTPAEAAAALSRRDAAMRNEGRRVVALEADYDAGYLNDFGGGDVSWWQDYLRAEIARANEHWRSILASLEPEGGE